MIKFRKVTRSAINLLVSIFLVLTPLLAIARPVRADVASTLEQIRSYIPSAADFQNLFNNASSANNAGSCANEIVSFVQSRYSSFPSSMFVDCAGAADNFNNIMRAVGQDFSRTPNFSALPAPVLGPDFSSSPNAGGSAQLSDPLAPIYASLVLAQASPVIQAANNAKSVGDCYRDIGITIQFISVESRLVLLPAVGIPGAVITAGWIIKSIVDCGQAYMLIASGISAAMSTNANRLPAGGGYCAAPKYASIACLNTKPNGTTIGGTPTTPTGGGGGGGQPVPVCSPGQNQIAVYTEKYYQGACVVKSFGDYNNSAAIGLPNDSIKSVKAGAGAKVWLCANDNINNPCEWFPPNDDDLSNNTINVNTVSSMRVISDQPTSSGCNPGDNEVAFFTDPNWGGACLTKGFGVYSDSGAIGLPDNSISSVKVGARAKVRICDNPGMNSFCEDLDQNDSDLANNTINTDRISSAEVYLKGGIRLCDGTNYGGPCKYFGTGKYNMQDYGWNDITESVAYDSDWANLYHIVLWSENNQTGNPAHYDNSIGDIGGAMRNHVRSIEIYKHTPPGATLGAPANSVILPSGTTSVTLNFDGGDQRRVHIWGENFDQNLDWTTAKTWQLNNLAQGTYYWQVQARGVAGEGPWSSTNKFSIDKPPVVISGQLTMDAGTTQSFQVHAFDYADEPLSLSASSMPSFASFTDNGSGVGVLALTPGANHSGVFPIDITANDGDLSSAGRVWVKVNGPGYKAEYFNNKTLSGTPVLMRDEAAIDNDWGTGSPNASVSVDSFSARWTKTINTPAGTYRFKLATDDGARLYIDNVLVIDRWFDQTMPAPGLMGPYSDRTLTAGDHSIKIEYYENTGPAAAKFEYALAPTSYQAQYFNNISLTGSPVLTRTESQVNYWWNSGSPDPAVQVDNFSARWTKIDTFTEGIYTFEATGDDGIRLYVDGQLIVDKWVDQGGSRYYANKYLSKGSHTVVFEYYEKGGGATAVLSYYKTSYNTPFKAEYFNNISLSGTPALTRTDYGINFWWGSASPAPGVVNPDNFSARWTRTANFSAGTHRFTASGDDGMRLYVDGQLKINGWNNPGTTNNGTIDVPLTAGQHTIVYEYYENGGWASTSLAHTILPQTITRQISSSADDAEQLASGLTTLNSDDLELTCDTTTAPCPTNSPQKQTLGLRFGSLNIPKGSTINSANIEFTADEAQSEGTGLAFYGQAEDNAQSFTTATNSISSRPKTTAYAQWVHMPAQGQFFYPWTVGVKAQTPNLAAPLQEVVSRPGWSPGNSAAFIVTGQGHRTADSFDKVGGSPPKLTVTFTPPLDTSGVANELLTSPWNLVGNGSTSDAYQSIPTNALAGKSTVRITYNLNGLYSGGNDISAIIFDQNDFKSVRLASYGQNALYGFQTVDIPLSDFIGLDPNQPVGQLHARFWYGGQYFVEITSIKVF